MRPRSPTEEPPRLAGLLMRFVTLGSDDSDYQLQENLRSTMARWTKASCGLIK